MEISLRGISLCCFTFSVFFLFWQFLYIFMRQDDPVELRIEHYQPKYILIYEAPDWMKRLPLVSMDDDCVVTSDKNYLDDIRKFDAVVFSGSDDWSAEKIFPQLRSSDQYYVFADLESPYYTNHKFSRNIRNEIYNLTMTYRRDSDIYWPYGFITAQNINFVTELEVPIWMDPDFRNNDRVLEVIKNKKKTAAWFVSKCLVASKRQFLVAVLRQQIDVDIYGICGAFSCSKDTMNDCYRLVERNYFFYLSLENSICKDYLTEKIFNLMRYYVVPVVYGGANYSQFLPPHSYIDANDFQNVTELANYLKYLTNNPDEYAKYFWWKKYYKNVSTLMSFNNLCKKLHKYTSKIKGEKFIRSYRNISSWWNDHQCMTEANIKFV